jgi:hypothetical protein
MGGENLCRLGKSDRGVLDPALRQLRATCMISLNRTQLEFCFLPDHQALPYRVGMQPEGLADAFKGVKRLGFFI